MRLILSAFVLALLPLAGCVQTPDKGSPELAGIWESESPSDLRLEFDRDTVTFVEVKKCCSLDGKKFPVTQLGRNHYSIGYRWSDSGLNLRITGFDVIVDGDRIHARCIYGMLRGSDANRYPVLTDESPPCTFRSFRRID